MLTNSYGFTLLEMLMVLFIVTIICFVTINCADGFSDKYEVNNAINTFGSDYNTMQTYAINNGVDCYIYLGTSSYKIYYDEELVETVYLEGVEMKNNFVDSKVKVNQYGNIVQAGTITFNNDEKLVFTIGEGRYEKQ